jgi:hypothetical protein
MLSWKPSFVNISRLAKRVATGNAESEAAQTGLGDVG